MAQFLVIDPGARNGGKNPAAWNALYAFAQAFYNDVDVNKRYSIYLYSANDRTHVENSLHYSDSAFDINLWNNVENHIENAKSAAYLKLQSKIKEIAKSFYLNLRDDIIYNGESDNNHLEYVGPKNTQNTSNYQSTYNICAEQSENFRSLNQGIQSKIVNAINKASSIYAIPVSLIISLIMTESDFVVEATSSAGAKGLTQLMPGTAGDLGVSLNEITDINKNINAGVKYLSQQLTTFNGDITKALKAYNAGPGAIQNAVAGYSEGIIHRYNEINVKHGNNAGVASFTIDKNKYDKAVIDLGLAIDTQPVSLVYKVKAIDKALFDLRQLYYQKQTIDPQNSKDWNTVEQLAMIFTQQVTGLFTKAIQSYNNLKGQNLGDEAIKTKFHNDMDYIIRAADTIPHMKNVVNMYKEQVNNIGTNAQNVLNYIQRTINNSI